MVVEIKNKNIPYVQSDPREWWDTAGVIHLRRDYDLFDEIQEKAYMGYPQYIDWSSKAYLDEHESWGECWMTMEEFKNLKYSKRHKEWKIFRKKLYPEMRCIFRFDN